MTFIFFCVSQIHDILLKHYLFKIYTFQIPLEMLKQMSLISNFTELIETFVDKSSMDEAEVISCMYKFVTLIEAKTVYSKNNIF